MTLYEFRSLDEMEQIEAYWEGAPVGSCVVDAKEFECKQINDFYVEFEIIDQRYRNMRCHKNTNLIERYLGNEPLNLL